MPWTRLAVTVAMLAVLGGRLFGVQDLPARNPLDGNSDATRAGMGLFRGRCADLSLSTAGLLTTACGLIFSADGDGNILVLDSRNGKLL
ncbi:MAG: hypothetical protein C5B57_14010 [Blastocatellia bacterium]|nr:MAG: hypothetical protein C5B57_14010 [Blastocatellia bacterium]